jgi:release factor glutamine methyltransferase
MEQTVRPEDEGPITGSPALRSPRHSFFRRWLRKSIHFLSYHLILSRKTTRISRAAGFTLTVHPTVFHPRYFLSSECFARFISALDLSEKAVADVGTGTGILALAAVRAGAKHVTATDINPNAAFTASWNARENGVAGRVTAVCCDLLSAFACRPLFDVILSSPPKHAGVPRDLADYGWHAGEDFRNIAAFFQQSGERLKPGGRIYVMISSDSDPALFAALIEKAGLRARIADVHSILIESFIIYELERPSASRPII